MAKDQKETPFQDDETASKADLDRAARGELENESQATGDGDDAPDARTAARRASTSSSTAAKEKGRQVAVVREDPDLDSAGERRAAKADIEKFADLTGYKASQVIGSNAARRTFVTDNGGKYVVSRNGKNVRVTSGPAYPKLRARAEEEGDEE